MALPDGISTCTVTFNSPLSFGGGIGVATLTVRPTETIIWAATGQPLGLFEDTVTANGVAGAIALPHVDQPGFVDSAGNAVTNWAYAAEILWTIGKQFITTHKAFQVVMGQSLVVLDLIPSGSPASPVSAPLPTVTSVNGATGSVTLNYTTPTQAAGLSAALSIVFGG